MSGAYSIQGIDFAGALRRFAGNEDALREVLRVYIRTTPLQLEQLAACGEKNLDDYAVTVHGIKGSSYGIEAQSVGKKAEALEHAARAGDYGSVRDNTAAFIAETEKLLAGIRAMLGSPTRQKPRKGCPDPEILAALRSASAGFDMDGVDKAMKTLEAFYYENGQELVDWLRTQVEMMNFREIYARLSRNSPEEEA